MTVEEARSVPIWLQVSEQDAENVHIETPLAATQNASCASLARIYSTAITPTSSDSERRIYSALAEICQMHLRPNEPNDPYGPMVIFPDGRRSAVPADFIGHIEILARWAVKIENPVLKARLADVVWFLDRKKHEIGRSAATAYSIIIEKAFAGELAFEGWEEFGPIADEASEILRRAVRIVRTINWDDLEAIAVKSLVPRLWRFAIEQNRSVAVMWFCDLDLDFGISDGNVIAPEIEEYVSNLPSSESSSIKVDLWRLTSRAYRKAKNDSKQYFSQTQAAESLVEEALSKQGSALISSHFLSLAIAELHGIPDQKDRRTELRHKLVDIQSRVGGEMKSFTHEIDLSEIVKGTQEILEPLSFIELLFAFAALDRSSDPKDLQDKAIADIRSDPLSSLFPAAHMDSDGKVLSRSSGGLGDTPDISQIAHEVEKNERIRRQITVSGKIEVARRSISSKHRIAIDTLRPIVDYSPFIPPNLVNTYSLGFTRLFQGDHVSAVYILVPLLEASIKHILKEHGHDVSLFDSATRTQQDRTISSIFEQMKPELEGIFTIAIASEIERLFLMKPGPHMRHAVAHGLLTDGQATDVDSIYSSWFIFRLCMMPLFPHRNEIVERLNPYFH